MKRVYVRKQRNRKAMKLHVKLHKLIKQGKTPNVKFYYADGGHSSHELKPAFLHDEKGRQRHTKEIAKDLHALKHDLNAVALVV